MKNKGTLAIRDVCGIKTFLIASFAMLLMTGCGGGPEKKDDKADSISSLTVESQKIGYGPLKPSSRSGHSAKKAAVSSSSFTVNSTKDFQGFNPEIWNTQSSWTECNCSNSHSAPPPKIVSWNP